MVPLMTGPGSSAVLPINYNTLPRDAEGSKFYQVTQVWDFDQQTPDPDGWTRVTINLLQAFQSGQFTTIQSVWIDNTQTPVPVTLTCAATQHVINVPAFSEGMYPLASATAPVFVLAMGPTYNVIPHDGTFNLRNYESTTRVSFFNTPARPFVSIPPNGGAFQSDNSNVVIGPFGPGADVGLFDVSWPSKSVLPSVIPIHALITAMQLALFNAGTSAFAANTGNTMIIKQNGIIRFTDFLNCGPGFQPAGGNILYYSKFITFPRPVTAGLSNVNRWTINLGASTLDGWICNCTYYFDLVHIE